jgi:hypothetical protein
VPADPTQPTPDPERTQGGHVTDRIIATLALALAGCTASVPVNLASARPGGISDAEIDLLLGDAGELLATPIVPVEDTYGAITLILSDVPNSSKLDRGEEHWDSGCVRFVWADLEAHVIAHELAHALGIEGDVDDPDNLMHFETPLGDNLDDTQLDQIDRSLSNLNACTARGAR